MIETVLALLLAADAPAPPAALERVLDALRPTQPSGATPVALVAEGEPGFAAVVRGMRVEARVAVRTAPTVTSTTSTPTPTSTPISTPTSTPTPTPTPTPPPTSIAIATSPPPPPQAPAHPERAREASAPSAPALGPLIRTVQRRLSPDGRLTVAFYAPDGTVEGRPIIRDVTTLPVVSQRRDDEGRVVRVVSDPSGAPIEILLDPMGRFLRATLLERTTTPDPR